MKYTVYLMCGYKCAEPVRVCKEEIEFLILIHMPIQHICSHDLQFLSLFCLILAHEMNRIDLICIHQFVTTTPARTLQLVNYKVIHFFNVTIARLGLSVQPQIMMPRKARVAKCPHNSHQT